MKAKALLRRVMRGVHRVQWGDWIIQGVKGELYPCKPDIAAGYKSDADIMRIMEEYQWWREKHHYHLPNLHPDDCPLCREGRSGR